MKRKQLPPLKSLIFFESAARLHSFTRASEELNVTQGAVSRQIRQLEQFLGKALFRRERRQVLLTDDGHNYYVSIAHLLSQLEDATKSLKGPQEPDQITFVTSSALAPMYLLPRLPDFREQHDDIHIRIVARDNLQDIDQSKFDLGLYYNRETPQKVDAHRLFDEEIFPVCSPEYLKQHKHRFREPDALSTDLIWLESDEDWINWPEWLDAMKIKINRFHNRLVVSNYPMVIQAAIAGQGIALAWSHLVDNEISQGNLVKPVDLTLTTGSHFYLIMPSNRPFSENTMIFRNWLIKNH